MRLSEELARILRGPPTRRRRRPTDQAPTEIVPRGGDERQAGEDPFDAARARLRRQIPPADDAQD